MDNMKWKNEFGEGVAEWIAESLQAVREGKDYKQVFERCGDYRCGFAKIGLDLGMGMWIYNYLNEEGKVLSDLWFSEATDFADGFARVEIWDVEGSYVLDTDGNVQA